MKPAVGVERLTVIDGRDDLDGTAPVANDTDSFASKID